MVCFEPGGVATNMTKDMGGGGGGMITPDEAARRALDSLRNSTEYGTFRSNGNFGGEFAQDFVFPNLPTGFA